MKAIRKLILIILLITPFLGKASHIVGGEFELLHISGSSYTLNLVLYFDHHNGSPGALDLSATVRFFRMRDNVPVMDAFLPLVMDSMVRYTQPVCTIEELETRKLIYSSLVTLSPSIFNDPMGYYVAWERCCRNYNITNIFSEDPNLGGIFAGQTFYLEIPPVVKNGQPFIDSTPRLFPPLSDYACKGQPYYVDFTGTDDDGDSLVYSLVSPLNTQNAEPIPFGGPRPKLVDVNGKSYYPEVNWKESLGFNQDHVMKGSPDLAISTEGMLTVTPTQPGLFVFAVRVEEFRGGVKIGETRRDFQMLALNCPSAVPPTIKARVLGDPEFNSAANMNLVINPGDQHCIQVQVSDDDVHNSLDNFREKIKIRARAMGNKQSLQEVIMPTVKTGTLTEQNTSATFNICFKECPLTPNVPYKIQIIASDDACALPLLDTLFVTVDIKIPPNTPAYFVEPDSKIIETVTEGSPKRDWPVKVVDDEGNRLTVNYLTDGFNLANVGMDFDFDQLVQGLINDTLSWDPTCDKYDFSVKRNFKITMIADDDDYCNYDFPDTAYFDLTLDPPPNADPIIDTDLTADQFEVLVDGGATRITGTIEFNVFGHDDDAAFPISLKAEGIGFQLSDYGIDFPLANGLPDISSHFNWPLICSKFNLSKKDLFKIRFIVVDTNNKCKIYQADTVQVNLKILPPVNISPEIALQNLHPETTVGLNEATSFWKDPIDFLITGTDEDETPVDQIKIALFGVNAKNENGPIELPTGYTFNPVSGQREIETNFKWTPDCSIFVDDNFANTYEFQFGVFDNHCQSADTTYINLTLNLKDYVSTDKDFIPPGVITTNGDDYNPYFALDGYDFKDPDFEVNLPLDNCVNKFEYINIYNRWGKLVFTSDNRYFRWYAPDAAAGVYYYFLKFTTKEYKGSLMVRY